MAKRQSGAARNSRLSLRQQLLVSMVLLIAVPLLFITVFGNYFYARAIDEQATEYTTQMLDQVRINVDNYVDTLDRVISYLTANRDVVDFLRLKDFYEPERIRLETAVRLQMRTYSDANPELLGGLLLAGENEMYVSNDLYRVSRYPLNNDDWYRQALNAGGDSVLISRPIGRNIRNYRSYSANDIVSVTRAVHDPQTGQLLGVICADMLTHAIEQRIREVTLGKTGYVFVMDANGEIVYAPVNETVYRVPAQWLSGRPEVHEIGGERYQLLSTSSQTTGWSVVGVFRSGETLAAIETLRRLTLLVTALAILLVTITSITFSNTFMRPITKLRRLMGEAERGNLNVEFDTQHYDGEIRQLGGSFNSMMDNIRDLLHQVYQEQQDKREAEIRTLQAQIKPHFLYNTLDTIRWMAEEHGAAEIVQMVSALTRLFRISLSRGREIIPLSEEMAHVSSYLYIQKVRYEEKLNYSIQVPEDMLDLQVNKLILQPLVENAIYHGIKQKRGAGHIVISARMCDAVDFEMRVADDGAGMPAEKCAMLNEELRSPTGMEYDHGYGIFNVNDRIRLSHGSRYGLRYEINESGGITVIMRYPAVRGLAEGGKQDG